MKNHRFEGRTKGPWEVDDYNVGPICSDREGCLGTMSKDADLHLAAAAPDMLKKLLALASIDDDDLNAFLEARDDAIEFLREKGTS